MLETTERTLGGAAAKVKEGAREIKEVLTEKASDTYCQCHEQTTAMIKDNPFTSVLVAFGVGAVCGAVATLLIRQR